jgi:hypothetical protein
MKGNGRMIRNMDLVLILINLVKRKNVTGKTVLSCLTLNENENNSRLIKWQLISIN